MREQEISFGKWEAMVLLVKQETFLPRPHSSKSLNLPAPNLLECALLATGLLNPS